jgi:tRNA pseudouridine13 synthase
MKLKRIVEDFQVEERVGLAPTGGGVALYRLTKQSLGTLEAVGAVARKWNLARGQIAFAGLKDKHALTRQFVTIAGGPRRSLSQENLSLEYVGQTARPIHAGDITANAFSIVIRDLQEQEANSAAAALESAAEFGVPNYFDDQRFGSLGESGRFIAEPWCRGQYEQALWLALAEPNARDRPVDRDEKRLLREQWGNWQACRQRLTGDRQRICALLAASGGDFRRAIAQLPHELRSLWLAAYQSHLWNQILAALLLDVCRPEQLKPHEVGRRSLPFFTSLQPKQADLLQASLLPLPSARLHLEAGPLAELYSRVLSAEGTALREIRIKSPRDSFFSKGERPALQRPEQLEQALAEDELYPGRQKLTLKFTLSRGSYATILVKRITGGGESLADAEDSA